MASSRGRHYFGKHKMKRGVALISVLTTAIIVALIIGGLYILLTRVFETSRMSGVYATTRDAARGGISYTVSQITGGSFDSLLTGDCPDGTASRPGNCCDLRLTYRLVGVTGEYTNTVTVCLTGYAPQPGFEIEGVAYTRPSPGGKGYVYTIVSEALGPQGSRSRVEAVYVR